MTDTGSLAPDQEARAVALTWAAAVLASRNDVSPYDLHSLARYIVGGGDPWEIKADLLDEPEPEPEPDEKVEPDEGEGAFTAGWRAGVREVERDIAPRPRRLRPRRRPMTRLVAVEWSQNRPAAWVDADRVVAVTAHGTADRPLTRIMLDAGTETVRLNVTTDPDYVRRQIAPDDEAPA